MDTGIRPHFVVRPDPVHNYYHKRRVRKASITAYLTLHISQAALKTRIDRNDTFVWDVESTVLDTAMERSVALGLPPDDPTEKLNSAARILGLDAPHIIVDTARQPNDINWESQFVSKSEDSDHKGLTLKGRVGVLCVDCNNVPCRGTPTVEGYPRLMLLGSGSIDLY